MPKNHQQLYSSEWQQLPITSISKAVVILGTQYDWGDKIYNKWTISLEALQVLQRLTV